MITDGNLFCMQGQFAEADEETGYNNFYSNN